MGAETYHLIDLFKLPILHLGEVEVRPQRTDQTRWSPDISVLGSPVQRIWVDEVWSCEGREPRSQKADRRRKTEGVTPQTLGWELAAAEPRVGCDHAVVADDIDD